MKLIEAVKDRILVLDGAMGTMIQSFGLEESDFRGNEFSGWTSPLKGCNDILALTRPEIIKDIHRQYLEAGANIIETDSFNSNAVSMADYRLEPYVGRLNEATAKLAREVADCWMAGHPGIQCWVAGSMGPTGKSLSMTESLPDGGEQAFNWDSLVDTYTEQASALINGGVDLLLVETAFDTLNAKAAILAARRAMTDCGIRVPLVISTTLTESGRTLSGQTLEAFVASTAHAEPLAIGLNCGFGADGMTTHLQTLKEMPYAVIAYPNAGLPNAMGEYDETPGSMAEKIDAMLSRGLLNIVGGCCGSTPAHIAEIAKTAEKYSPRHIPARGHITSG